MITYTSGDLLKSDTEALVNTVNCEGFMGKGIAYQFKLQFPDNNKDYIKACQTGNLKIGKLHYTVEQGKIIINFPTKDKWRAKSKITYIEKGLDALVDLIEQLNIKSISIPPLGSGNGGLVWGEVKPLIERKLESVALKTDVFIYEPSQNYISRPTNEPKLSVSALVLMEIKNHLQKFNNLRLQKAAFMVDILSKNKYFKFQKHLYGPYDNSITIISRNIKAFQLYHNVKDTEEAKSILYNKIVSENVVSRYTILLPLIIRACTFINSIETDHELECLITILFLIDEDDTLLEEDIVNKYLAWSDDKADRFSKQEIRQGVETLLQANVIEKKLVGYTILKDETTSN
ncbi:macro domain-containing protein [Paenibacillus thiaminolyticus]|uniref:type II toxin-antitoxin system antitoxin DNA ADP-ribosyl glycohydrolase DarG n=1 Tax=Paenibacillus thiaminolyticus TaxID=49283 RepID=UPI003D2C5F13